MNQDILKKFSSHSEVQSSPYHKHVSTILKKHVDNLLYEKDSQAKIKELENFLIEKMVIVFPPDNQFYYWLMNPWVVTMGLINLITNMKGSAQRDKLSTLEKTTKEQIKSLTRIKQCPDFLALYQLENSQFLNIDQLIENNESILEFLKWFQKPIIKRGNPLAPDKLLSTAFLTLFFIGQKILNLSEQGKSKPLFRFIEIITGYSNDNLQISKWFKKYKNIEPNFSTMPEFNNHETHRFICNANIIEKIEFSVNLCQAHVAQYGLESWYEYSKELKKQAKL